MKSQFEIWKWVPGYEGYYKVSNCGAVKSVDRYIKSQKEGIFALRKGAFMYGKLNDDGYRVIHFSKNRKTKMRSVHRLVAEAFIPNPDNLPEVNHRDEDKTNNHVENLEWCTHDYNIHYGTALERSKQHNRTKELRSKKVNQYTLDGILVRTWDSLKDIYLSNGWSCGNISQVCHGKWNTAYGYKWLYA